MALINKLAHDDGYVRMRNHQFGGACWFWAKGKITRQNIIDRFELEASDEDQLDQLATHYQGLTVGQKQEFYSDLHAGLCMLEDGLLSKAEFGALLGMT